MEKITSFTIDHLRLVPGVYVSRKDMADTQTVTTFDLRITRPNEEPVMNTAEVHTIEHLGATFLRNHPRVQRPCTLLRSHGLPYRILSPAQRRLRICRYSPTGKRNVSVHFNLRGRSSRGFRKRLRQLPGHEPSDGKILCKKIPPGSPGQPEGFSVELSCLGFLLYSPQKFATGTVRT